MLPSTTSPSDSRRLINQPPPPSAAKNPQFLTNRPSKRESSSVFRCTRGIKRDSSRSARPRCLEFRLKNEIPRPRDRRQGDSPHTWRGDSRNAATRNGGRGRERQEERLSYFSYYRDISPRDSLISVPRKSFKAARREDFWGKGNCVRGDARGEMRYWLRCAS